MNTVQCWQMFFKSDELEGSPLARQYTSGGASRKGWRLSGLAGLWIALPLSSASAQAHVSRNTVETGHDIL